ncbi:MAG: DMT family transporter [Granulosicoccus sp.]|nr:DMT family transporter [Granulosicoccus sp.]
MLGRLLSGSHEDSPLLAIVLMLLALILLSGQDAMVKLISSDTSLWQFQTLRAVLNLCFVAVMATWFYAGRSLRPLRFWAVALRSLFHLGALSFFFAGAPWLTLAEMAGGLYTFPLFVVLLSLLFTRERVGIWRMLGVAAGFTGTLLVLRPGSDTFQAVALLPVAAGFCYGCFVITTRRLCRQESPLVLVLGSNIAIVTVGSLGWYVIGQLSFSTSLKTTYPFLLNVDLPLTSYVILIIAICAVLNTTANLFLGKAYQSADSSFLAPVDYSYLIFATGWGWLIWQDIPSSMTIAGLALISFAGIFVAWRERIVRRQAEISS